ncbi:unnamed protein product [Miscanthus lutarioriparius]|uniref:NB-ARC domain-containing protein n=1 Tax=Miscanthus lutarioriparius TaxID=422564 RepID=A0A811RD03_9POAL|nr:unnamed protein product [Miscanthus lutarioriparius]
MGNKLRMILNAIEVLVTEMHAFRFRFQPQPPMPKSWRHTESDIINLTEIASQSRHKDKEEVVNKLIGDRASNLQLTVLPIVGMGGLGETTLAQLVYNDPEIQKHFQLQLWVCVSDNFEVDPLAKSIAEANAKGKNNINTSEKSPLDSLKEVASGKRYLLVLDDVWNRDANKWGKLKSCLQNGGNGSAVLTTTCDNVVAELMGTTEAYILKSLEQRFIMKIIMARAFSSKKEQDAKLVEMVGDIAKRYETGILPILKLSYNGLPSHMRQCFAFCAIFPKDYDIDVEKLIQLWMANGFFPEQHGVRPEITGKQIFIDLVSRSFFQDVKEVPFEVHDIWVPRVTCKIHDLMHDVAQSSMGAECATIVTEQSQSEKFPNSARHLFISVDGPETILNGCLEKGSMAVQTLICNGYADGDLKHLLKYRSIRALRIHRGSFLKPKYLHHLRLTLTWTSSLEKEEEEQHNTKVLKALKPDDGLKVLDIYGYRGGTYPTWINTLQQMELKELSLRIMPNFETWWVNEVQGEESIFPQVKKLSISDCKRLTALPKASMIKEPRPPCGVINTVWRSAFPALKELKLYRLETFQRWEAVQETLGEDVTFPRLEKLVIESCPELTSLPEAPNLSELKIRGGSQQMQVQVANCIVTASSLSKLDLWINDDREAAWLDGNSLIQLVDGEEKRNHNKSPSPLTLHGCNVFFSHSSALALWACLVQLEDLRIWDCDTLVHWPEEVFQSLESLRKLEICECNNLTGRRHASSEQPRLESLDI